MLGLLLFLRRSLPALSSILLALSFLLVAVSAHAEGTQSKPQETQATDEANSKEFKRFDLIFEPDAYYTDLDFIISLTKNPIPHIGEKSELEIYTALLSRSAVLPQFLVLEASINPLPYLGTYIRSHAPDFYRDAVLFGNFNWIKALTAGFDEPYAFSVLAGNVVNFDVPGSKDTAGLGYSGYLVSYGNFHIKDNRLINDDWWEFEWKIKGDRKSPVKKLNWSFRIGAKEHGNKNITDTLYISFRRSRVDYKPEGYSLLNNTGFEYTYYMDRRTFSAVEHYLTVDKKWPLESWRIALSLGVGFVWDSSRKYSGSLATGRDNFQFLIRPNIEF
jgi:hypothetical protein